MKKSAFTLVETIITIVIMSILIGIVFEIFIVISHIAIFTQYQRAVHNEMVFVMQTMQNLVDDQDTIMSGFDLSPAGDAATDGFKTSLFLVDDLYEYTFSRVCGASNRCYLEMKKELINAQIGIDVPEYLQLTDPALVTVTNFYVKRLPFEPETTFEDTMHEGFRMFMSLQIPEYNEEKWWFKVKYDMQSFFTIRKY